MIEPTLREVVKSDAGDLTQLFLYCFNGPPWNDGWSREAAEERLDGLMTAPHFRGYLAVYESRVVGMLLGQKERWVHDYHFNLQEMCVLPSMQRSGVGTALMRHAQGALLGENVDKVYLITAPGDAAEAFYGKLGFYKSRGRIVMGFPLRGP